MCGFESRETKIGKMLPGWVDFLGTLQGGGKGAIWPDFLFIKGLLSSSSI